MKWRTIIDQVQALRGGHAMTKQSTKQSSELTEANVRSGWDEYFLNIAMVVASRSTCPRASVGAVIVRDKRIVATGYNGAPSGEPHCTEVGCLMVDGHCQRVLHAETNAIAQAARFGIAVQGATLYYWDSLNRSRSCTKCAQLTAAAGLTRIVTTAEQVGK